MNILRLVAAEKEKKNKPASAQFQVSSWLRGSHFFFFLFFVMPALAINVLISGVLFSTPLSAKWCVDDAIIKSNQAQMYPKSLASY